MTLEIGLSIEGQEGVSWPQWLGLARVAEEHGFPFLYRSDHYLSEQPASGRAALDAWGTICGLAAVTSRIRLGTLVSPVTFRHPSVLARLAVTAGHISGGRVDVGIGAGWYPDEHRAHGFDLPELPVRLELLAEQLEILVRSWDAAPFTFHGRHYELVDSDPRPKPAHGPPRVVVGGTGGPRSLALAALWADEYNLPPGPVGETRLRIAAVRAACARVGRAPETMRISMSTAVVCGADRAEIDDRTARACRFVAIEEPPDTWLVGTPDRIATGLTELASLGLDRIMLWPPNHDDLDMIGLVGRAVLPAAGTP